MGHWNRTVRVRTTPAASRAPMMARQAGVLTSLSTVGARKGVLRSSCLTFCPGAALPKWSGVMVCCCHGTDNGLDELDGLDGSAGETVSGAPQTGQVNMSPPNNGSRERSGDPARRPAGRGGWGGV